MITRVTKQFDPHKGVLQYKAMAYGGDVLKIEFFKTIDEAYQWCADVVTMYEGEGV